MDGLLQNRAMFVKVLMPVLSFAERWTQILGPCGLEDGPRTINNPEPHVEDYWSRHPGGANFLFADGSVHFLKSSINPTLWRALATRNFGEVISADPY
jgi:prepilin-type processing-associated H-X9-DG protein